MSYLIMEAWLSSFPMIPISVVYRFSGMNGGPSGYNMGDAPLVHPVNISVCSQLHLSLLRGLGNSRQQATRHISHQRRTSLWLSLVYHRRIKQHEVLRYGDHRRRSGHRETPTDVGDAGGNLGDKSFGPAEDVAIDGRITKVDTAAGAITGPCSSGACNSKQSQICNTTTGLRQPYVSRTNYLVE